MQTDTTTTPCPPEAEWRLPPAEAYHAPHGATVLVTRWADERATARVERSITPPDRFVIAIALRPVRIRLSEAGAVCYEGTMPSGMIHVSEPGQVLSAEMVSPCEFVHFHLAAGLVRERQAASAAAGRSLGGLLFRDDLAAQLARTLTNARYGGDPLYAASVGQTVLARVLALRPAAPRVGTLPKWRLRRVQEHLAANISEPISLADLARAAGLSRMHFAAQFRAATGCRPHDYLLQQRIERAKQLLAATETPLVQVALSVGFQTQSHFSTVFKRLAGETPARWQRSQRAA